MPKSLRHPRPWLSAFWQRAYTENVTGLSAMVAYNLMLAVFPFALLVLFVFGQVLKIEGVETSVVSDLERLFPSVEQQTLTDVLNRIQDNSTTIGIAAFLGSLWIGASFWGAMDTAFCPIYLSNVSSLSHFGSTLGFILIALLWFYVLSLALLAGAVVNSLRYEVHDTGELPYGKKRPCNGCDDSPEAGAKPPATTGP